MLVLDVPVTVVVVFVIVVDVVIVLVVAVIVVVGITPGGHPRRLWRQQYSFSLSDHAVFQCSKPVSHFHEVLGVVVWVLVLEVRVSVELEVIKPRGHPTPRIRQQNSWSVSPPLGMSHALWCDHSKQQPICFLFGHFVVQSKSSSHSYVVASLCWLGAEDPVAGETSSSTVSWKPVVDVEPHSLSPPPLWSHPTRSMKQQYSGTGCGHSPDSSH